LEKPQKLIIFKACKQRKFGLKLNGAQKLIEQWAVLPKVTASFIKSRGGSFKSVQKIDQVFDDELYRFL
jgi:hypothetical protein